MSYRGRFAPSPTGPLHLGSLVAALCSWLRARQENGTWLIRMEDLDPPREVPGAAADILATLAAFGMESDEPIVYQSARTHAYQNAFEQLQAAQEVFPCWCSRADLEHTLGLHRGACLAPPDPGRAPAWRLRVPDLRIEFDDIVCGAQSQNLLEDIGDFVIRRADGWFAYQLAVVVDDASARVSEIVRGADLLDSTPRQIYLQRLLGYALPSYLHLPLVLDANGQKLSKQDHARPVDRGNPVPALREALRFLGLGSAAKSANVRNLLRSALADFDVANIRKSTAPSPQCAMDTP